MIFDYPDHIVLDDIDTWPSRVRRYLTKKELKLQEYREIESQIDIAAKTDVTLRDNRPGNKNKNYWDKAINRISDSLKGIMVVSFHCSRLTEDKISDVKQNGLRPLTNELTIARINTLSKNELISQITAQQLIQNNEANATNRSGNVCFFHCPMTLKDEGGLYRLFRAWGGEAIYLNHENNPKVMRELTIVGKPCIVVASIFPSELSLFHDLEERLINVWLDRNIETEISRDCDSFVQREVSVLEIIEREDPRFESLTNCNSWRDKI